MTTIPIPDTGVRMGRPSLKVKPTVIRMTEDVRKRIEAVAGPHKMSEFIREAIDRELKRREKGKG